VQSGIDMGSRFWPCRAARQHLDAATGLLDELGARVESAKVRCAMARLACAEGDVQRAKDALEEAHALAEGTPPSSPIWHMVADVEREIAAIDGKTRP
jgi:hypothetical protein